MTNLKEQFEKFWENEGDYHWIEGVGDESDAPSKKRVFAWIKSKVDEAYKKGLEDNKKICTICLGTGHLSSECGYNLK